MQEATPLQTFIRAVIDMMPEKRDHYDKLLQEKLGTKGKPIYDIDRGKSKNPSLPQLNAISEVLGQPRELFERAIAGEVVEPVRVGAEPVKGQYHHISASEPRENVVTLRSFDLSYAMGPGTNIDDYVEEGTYEFDRNMLSKLTRAPVERLFVARGDGDSMFPTLLNDDMVVIDTTQRVLNLRDRIWACSIYGAGAIKRLRPVADGKVEVISDNPAISDDVVNADDIHIVGRVIWLGRRI